VPWTFRMKDGHILWDDLVVTYSQGVDEVHSMQATWETMRDHLDAQRFEAVASNLRIQAREAKWWRDASIAYFQSKSGLPLPKGYAAPEKPLADYKAISFPYAPGQGK